MGDLISRRAAIDALRRAEALTKAFGYHNVLDTIRELPSAQPERKKGKWIWDEDGVDWGLGAWCCSECKRKPETWWESDKRANPLRCAGGRFCGNCGADMRGEQDEHHD